MEKNNRISIPKWKIQLQIAWHEFFSFEMHDFTSTLYFHRTQSICSFFQEYTATVNTVSMIIEQNDGIREFQSQRNWIESPEEASESNE